MGSPKDSQGSCRNSNFPAILHGKKQSGPGLRPKDHSQKWDLSPYWPSDKLDMVEIFKGQMGNDKLYPAWELTYPFPRHFWVDDFPNFSRWDIYLYKYIHIYVPSKGNCRPTRPVTNHSQTSSPTSSQAWGMGTPLTFHSYSPQLSLICS